MSLALPVISFMIILLKGKEKGCSIANRAFCPDPSIVSGDNPLDSREPNARAWIFSGGMKALESAKQLISVAHVEPGAIVANEIRCTPGFILDTDFDRGILSLRREFPGIAKQVLKSNPSELRIS